MDNLKIVVADDHPLFRYGLECALTIFNKTFKILQASCGKEVLSILQKEKIDIIFMDIRMPGCDGIETTRMIRKTNSTIKIIAISMMDDQYTVMKMIDEGANAYLHKAISQKTLGEVIHAVYNNQLYFCDQVADYSSKIFQKDRNGENDKDVLTSREIEILILICRQYSSKEIALQLHLNEKTVESHRIHIMEKTRAKNMVGLALYAIERGFILPEFRKKNVQ